MTMESKDCETTQNIRAATTEQVKILTKKDFSLEARTMDKFSNQDTLRRIHDNVSFSAIFLYSLYFSITLHPLHFFHKELYYEDFKEKESAK